MGGAEDANLLVILNDNCMSIDPNVGALKEYLTDITTSKTYNKVKDEVWHLLGRISKFGPNAQAIAQKVEGRGQISPVEPIQSFRVAELSVFRSGRRPRCGTCCSNPQ